MTNVLIPKNRGNRRRVDDDADVVVKLLGYSIDQCNQIISLNRRDSSGQVNRTARSRASSTASTHDAAVVGELV
jgi:hypothetical protein